MSNLVEKNFTGSLLDKLIFPTLSGKETPLPKNFTGLQNFVGESVKMDYALLSEFHEMLNPDCFAPNFPAMNSFGGVKNLNPQFDTSNFLVSRVSKLFFPSIVPLQDFHLLSNQVEYLQAPEGSHFTRRGSILGEVIDQLDLFVNKGHNFKSYPNSKSMPSSPKVPPAPTIDIQSTDVLSDEVGPHQVAPKAPIDNTISSQIMNQKFVDRKAKKMNKRSRKRRRREKNRAKNSPGSKEIPISDQEGVKRMDASQDSHSVGESRDVFCDIISVTGQILPEIMPFVISVESVVDDDTDWDVCSDSDWLNDCSEFELTGLFIGNLKAPTVNSYPVSSRLEVPSAQESREALNRRKELLNVNKVWEKSTLDIRKPRLSPKVSFAPDKDLVTVFEVEDWDRKGEWEIYAHERMRFKRRIDELESVISPCLKEEHREKVFKNLHKL